MMTCTVHKDMFCAALRMLGQEKKKGSDLLSLQFYCCLVQDKLFFSF